jgi:ABC-type multidrug transport system ATPase subunit
MSGAVDGIRLRGLHKRYGATVALAGLDLDIRPGEVLGVAR